MGPPPAEADHVHAPLPDVRVQLHVVELYVERADCKQTFGKLFSCLYNNVIILVENSAGIIIVQYSFLTLYHNMLRSTLLKRRIKSWVHKSGLSEVELQIISIVWTALKNSVEYFTVRMTHFC